MKNQNRKTVEETFYLGSTHVTIINPNSFFPENVNDRTLSEFFYENEKILNRFLISWQKVVEIFMSMNIVLI